MQTFNTVKYKWEHGSYNIEDMIKLVEKEEITKEEFFIITRYHFDKKD